MMHAVTRSRRSIAYGTGTPTVLLPVPGFRSNISISKPYKNVSDKTSKYCEFMANNAPWTEDPRLRHHTVRPK
jgi:hypothetical protein